MTIQEIDSTVQEIFALYEKFGAENYYGEAISQLEHMCQSAELARLGGYDDEVVLAAFLHDIGYLLHAENSETMGDFGRKNHEKEAGKFIRQKGFSEKVARLAEEHVNAKRYLTFASPDYYERLSEASKKTLEYQGGKMNEQDAKAFRNEPLFDLFITMRMWDEEAKVQNQPLPDLNIYKEIARKHLVLQ